MRQLRTGVLMLALAWFALMGLWGVVRISCLRAEVLRRASMKRLSSTDAIGRAPSFSGNGSCHRFLHTTPLPAPVVYQPDRVWMLAPLAHRVALAAARASYR